jgi:dTDP-4-dehydrorhamnose reductase
VKILITGALGQLGSMLEYKLKESHEVYGFSSSTLDITNRNKVFSIIKDSAPQIVINCASYNKVDDAERYKEVAREINEIGTLNLASVTQEIGATIIHISTDYVFDGTKKTSYIEEDAPNPLNYYGYTKYQSEQIVKEACSQYILLRTSWLYSNHNRNFVNTISQLAKDRGRIKVVDDQIGSPTNVCEAADTIKRLIDNNCRGIYHCSGNGECSWYQFAEKIVELAHIPCQLEKITSKEYAQLASRPKYSVLDNYNLRNTIGDKMKNWEESLEEFFKINKI